MPTEVFALSTFPSSLTPAPPTTTLTSTDTHKPPTLLGMAGHGSMQEITLDDILRTQGLASRLSRPYALAESSGMSWTYQNPDELQKELCRVFRDSKDKYDADERDETNVSQTLLCAGLGMGKSRALMTVPHLLESVTKNKKVFVFNVSFGDRTAYSKSTEQADMRAVINRICHHLLCVEENFPQWIERHRTTFSFDELVSGLCRSQSVEHKDNKDVVCLLMLDGVHNMALHELAPGTDDPLCQFLRDKLQTLQRSSSYFVFPVCTLNARKSAVEALKESSVQQEFLPVPSITAKPLCGVEVSDRLFAFVKGHGRAVEVLCQERGKHPEKTESEVLSSVCDELVEACPSLVVSKEDQKKLLKYALLRLPVDEDHELAGYLSDGLMVLCKTPGGQAHLHISLIWALANTRQSGSLLSEYDFHGTLHGSAFKSFLMWYRRTLSQLHVKSKCVELADLHKGVTWLTECKGMHEMEFQNIHLTPNLIDWPENKERKKMYTLIFPDPRTKYLQDIHLLLGPTSEYLKNYTDIPFPVTQRAVVNLIKRETYGDDMVMLFFTTDTVPCAKWAKWFAKDEFLKDCNIGVVHAGNFEDYFHFFAPLWLREKQSGGSGAPKKLAGKKRAASARVGTGKAKLPLAVASLLLI